MTTEQHFTQIKNELIRSSKLTLKERAVLFVLLSYADCEEIFISQSKIAEQSGMKRKSVIEAVAGLRQKGLLKTTLKPDRSTLVYKIHTKAVVSKTDNVVSKTDRGLCQKRTGGCVKNGQGVVSKTDTSNKSIRNKSIRNKRREIKNSEFDLPEWLDKEAWAEWVQHRKEIKKKLTPVSVNKQLNMLEKNKSSHIAIISNAIEKGWTGLYPIVEKVKATNQDSPEYLKFLEGLDDR